MLLFVHGPKKGSEEEILTVIVLPFADSIGKIYWKATDPIEKELADIQKQLQTNRDLSLMVEKHNAVALWESELKNTSAILTINMQEGPRQN